MTAALEVKDEVKPAGTAAQPVALARTEGAKRAIASITPNSAIELLHVALEKGTDVDSLEKLLTLHERIADRQAAAEFALAVAAFQEECPPVRHNKDVDFTTKQGQDVKYGYASLDEIARKINPILAKHGLSYTWDSAVANGMLTCVCTVRHIAGHKVSSSFTLPTESNSVASPQQKIGMALTFAQRRSLSSALGLTTTDEDVDAAEVDPTPINDDQATLLDDMIREVGVNRVRFLKLMEVKELKEIRAVDYNTALAAIEDYRAAKARRPAGAAS